MIAGTFRFTRFVIGAAAINLFLITASSALGQSVAVLEGKPPEPKIVEALPLNGGAPIVASGEKNQTVAAPDTNQPDTATTIPAAVPTTASEKNETVAAPDASQPDSAATKPTAAPKPPPPPPQCKRMIKADVVAIPQPI